MIVIFLTGCSSETHVHPIEEEGNQYDFSFVDSYIEDKQIIFLGESTHTAKEFTALKAELVKYLHEQHDFSVLAMESGKNEIDFLNTKWEEFDDRFMLENMILAAWHTSDMENLVAYIRDSQLKINGLDPLPVTGNVRRVERMELQQFLKSLIEPMDEGLADEFIELERDFIDYMQILPFEHENKADLQKAQEMKGKYETFLNELGNFEIEEHVIQFVQGRISVLETFTAEFLAEYDIDHVYQDYFSRRDLTMFHELQALLEQNPDEKIIVWAHNGHVQKNFDAIEQTNEGLAMDYSPPPLVLGTLANEKLGDISYYVGFYFNQGKILLDGVEKIDPKKNANELEYVLSEYGHERLFVDLNEYDADWVNESITAHDNGLWDYKMVSNEQYDALIFIDTVTPSSWR